MAHQNSDLLLSRLLTADALRRAAGLVVFERGGRGATGVRLHLPPRRRRQLLQALRGVGVGVAGGTSVAPKQKPITRREVRKWLKSRTKKDLVELLLDHAKTDDRLDRRLTLATARAARGPVNRATFERALDDALCCDGYVAWDEMYEYTRNIDDVVDSIEKLLQAGHAAEVVELTETALDREGEFLPYAAGVRVAHRTKRNFTARLDAAAWS